jgi:hypothetical protein
MVGIVACACFRWQAADGLVYPITFLLCVLCGTLRLCGEGLVELRRFELEESAIRILDAYIRRLAAQR